MIYVAVCRFLDIYYYQNDQIWCWLPCVRNSIPPTIYADSFESLKVLL